MCVLMGGSVSLAASLKVGVSPAFPKTDFSSQCLSHCLDLCSSPALPRFLSLSLHLGLCPSPHPFLGLYHSLWISTPPTKSLSPISPDLLHLGGSDTHTHLRQTLSLSSGILSLSLPGLSIPLSEVSVPLISLLDQHYLWVSRVLLWVFVL